MAGVGLGRRLGLLQASGARLGLQMAAQKLKTRSNVYKVFGRIVTRSLSGSMVHSPGCSAGLKVTTVHNTCLNDVRQQRQLHSSGTLAQYAMDGRTALVTGSTSGIGLGIARKLAEKGCSVILTGFADQELIDKLIQEFTGTYNVKANYIPADLAKVSDIEDLCRQVNSLCPSGLDVLVNNAGFQFVKPIEEFPTETWDAMIAVMLTAPYHLIKNLLPGMKKKGYGRIINMSSAHGVVASPNKSAYVSAKHGIVGLSKVVALEAAGTGVTCNALCPGYVDTPILQMQVNNLSKEKNISYEDAKREFLCRFHATGEPVGIDHLGEMVAFLCSEAGSQMTGSSIVMDGAWTAK